MTRNDTPYGFYFCKLHKSWRSGKASPTVSYQAYAHDPNLCVLVAVDDDDNDDDDLFLWNS